MVTFSVLDMIPKHSETIKIIFLITSSPLECKSINYELKIGSSSYPTVACYDLLKEQPVVQKYFGHNQSLITFDRLKSSIIALNVYYESLKYTEISQNPQMQLIDLAMCFFFF
jgi:hypothetical protein